MSLQFKREHRYFVFKVKNLTQEQQQRLFDFEMELGPRNSVGECVVVESDWPNYQETWDSIRDVSCGTFKPREVLVAERNALAKEVDEANDRIGELERDEPNHDDIIALRMALGKAGIATPESDEELAVRWISHVRHLIRSVSKWGFVAASERDALAAQVEALRSAIEPFATGGVCSAIDREDYSIMRERIKDWHGAIEFKKAQDAYNSTPQQCLRDVQAEAGRAGFVAGFKKARLVYSCEVGYCKTTLDEYADDHAATVRQGGAE